MGCMSLFNRKADLPGLQGATRICTPQGKGLKRLSEGDLAIIDAPDLSRTFAQRLLAAKPAAVLNVSRFTTGSVPNFGPQMLIDGATQQTALADGANSAFFASACVAVFALIVGFFVKRPAR